MLPLLALLVSAPAHALAQASAWTVPAPAADQDHVKASLVSEFDGVQPGGTLTLAAVFDIDKDWHIYWPGQNDTGQAPKFDPTKLPPGVSIGDIAWPVPHRQVLPGGIVDHIYEKQAVILVPLKVASTVKAGQSLTIELPIEWMECASVCRLGGSTVTCEIKVVERSADAKPGAGKAAIDAARTLLPKPQSKVSDIKVERSRGAVTFTAPGADALTFMPHESSVALGDVANGASASGDSLRCELKADASKLRSEAPVIGILTVTRGKKVEHVLIDTTAKAEKNAEKPAISPSKDEPEGTPAKR